MSEAWRGACSVAYLVSTQCSADSPPFGKQNEQLSLVEAPLLQAWVCFRTGLFSPRVHEASSLDDDKTKHPALMFTVVLLILHLSTSVAIRFDFACALAKQIRMPVWAVRWISGLPGWVLLI